MKKFFAAAAVVGLILGAYAIGKIHGEKRAALLLCEQWITMQFIEASWDMDGKKRIEEEGISGPEYLGDRVLGRLDDVQNRLKEDNFEEFVSGMKETISRGRSIPNAQIYEVLNLANLKYQRDYRKELEIEPVD